jgi:S1-C subfamily serine protease
MLIKTSILALALALAGVTHANAQQGTAVPATTGQRVPIPGKPRVFTGLSFSRTNGAPPVVVDVAPDSPASRAGLAAGDTILTVDGHDTTEPGPLFPGIVPGKTFTLGVRGAAGQERTLVLVVAPPRTEARQ